MEKPKESIFKKLWVQSLAGIFLIILLTIGLLSYKYISSHVSIDKSAISAPIILIGPETSGILDEVYVKTGDQVQAGQILARVGAEVLSAKVAGTVIDVSNTPGQVFGVGQTVVKMIDPRELRVVGTIKENEGLSQISIGDPVSFTVDAFAGKTYSGVIDSISATAKDTSVVFSISDKREEKEFDVKAKYDITANPEFLNGMSAKMQVYKK
jgi:multidrug resistance efflux pump